jgi:hypothetical protein
MSIIMRVECSTGVSIVDTACEPTPRNKASVLVADGSKSLARAQTSSETIYIAQLCKPHAPSAVGHYARTANIQVQLTHSKY